MKRNLWNDLAKRVRQSELPVTEMPFQFDERVLRAVNAASPSPGNTTSSLLALWMPILRPAVGLAFLVATICLVASSKPSKPSTDFVAETVSILQMAVLNE
jgi:hypothetical protein